MTENRAIGRAYLAQLYRRYKNWPDAIAAYNWGMANVDNWVKAGRPADKFLIGVAAYLRRVLHDSGMCGGPTAATVRPPAARTLQASRYPREAAMEKGELEADAFALSVCTDLDAWGGTLDAADRHLLGAPGRFYNKLEKAMLLVAQHLPASRNCLLEHRAAAPAARTRGRSAGSGISAAIGDTNASGNCGFFRINKTATNES
ncbi:MAG: lytic transglycosylase domain-containing protein [Alphaproteobacteria bacterium]|nr:lytic transglycosylase domain-containing protein [Alphaproteobacteria bacterium]